MLAAAAIALSLTQYKLVWSDEFNKDGEPNPAYWIYETGFVRNREPQLYRKENVTVKDGCLVITGRKEPIPNPDYDPKAPESDWRRTRKYAEFTSGSIKTATKKVWTYGRFECRGRFDVELGLWPAFWMTGPTRGWPANGEIDIMEYYQRTYLANLAWGGKGPGAAKWKAVKTPIANIAKQAGYASPEAWAKDFHVYRMDWDAEAIRLFLDGRLLNETFLKDTVNESPDGANPFREPHHVILNLALGATGGDTSAVHWPAKFLVDYVRVYQVQPASVRLK